MLISTDLPITLAVLILLRAFDESHTPLLQQHIAFEFRRFCKTVRVSGRVTLNCYCPVYRVRRKWQTEVRPLKYNVTTSVLVGFSFKLRYPNILFDLEYNSAAITHQLTVN